jgi:flagellin
MALRINTNVAALNAHRQLMGTDARLSANMEKLSSGYRINRASDDAAGLSVANRLRATIKSFTVASRNVSEAKALINVAEGAANQISGILDRMKELATQSASANAANDRDKIQAEFVSLTTEITRIVDDTDYQGTVLLTGGFGNGVSTTGGTWGTDAGATTGDIYVNGAAAGVYTIAAADGYMTMTDGSSTQRINIDADESGVVNFDQFGISISLTSLHGATALNATSITVSAATAGGVFQVGTSNASSDTIGLQIGSMTLADLGLSSASVATQASASSALSLIDAARDVVAGVLGDMGAAVNRMDYTYSNIQVSIENFSASESVIRDVDMAAEMVTFTKNQIRPRRQRRCSPRPTCLLRAF